MLVHIMLEHVVLRFGFITENVLDVKKLLLLLLLLRLQPWIISKFPHAV